MLYSIKYFREIKDILISSLTTNDLNVIFNEFNINEKDCHKKININNKKGLLEEILKEEKNSFSDIQKIYFKKYNEPIIINKVLSKITYDEIYKLFYTDEDAKFYITHFYKYLEEEYQFNILELHKILEEVYNRKWYNSEIKGYIENRILNKYENGNYIHIGRSSNKLPSLIIDNFMSLSDNKKIKIANSLLKEIYLTSIIKVLNHSFTPHNKNNIIRVLEIIYKLNELFLTKETLKIIRTMNLNLIQRCINFLKGARYG